MNATRDADHAEIVRRIAAAQLSLWPRIAHGALLAAALAMTIVLVSLWLTEPDLPLRTRTAFAVLAAIGGLWSGYAAWVLTARRVLFARQRVVAGWLALAFTTIFTTGAFAIAAVTQSPAGWAAGSLGLGLIGVSTLVLLQSRARLADLMNNKRMLEALRAGAVR
ncbi:hypothetical protein RZN05_09395 [Sphingomonas sp. HF-S4]|uniref:Transmembrane protein n=1 Tax=Sphingomonas agrestis TaxID=3080540 RepID=A0ABU3Y724_9SPHN|nr:hypothetical protein [Sphingomonas sp. HF-S4]MDV3457195.1 hypothetical protein [Sphingomonas sp. HF-S4]